MTRDQMLPGALGISSLSLGGSSSNNSSSSNKGASMNNTMSSSSSGSNSKLHEEVSPRRASAGDEEEQRGFFHDNEMSVAEAKDLVLRWDEETDAMVWESSNKEFEAYLAAVDKLLQSSSSPASSVHNALNLAARRLRDEFKHLLIIHSEVVDSSWLPDSFSMPSFSSTTEEDADASGGSNDQQQQLQQQSQSSRSMSQQSCVIDLLPPAIVCDLSDMASRMLALGAADDCMDAYIFVRRGVIDDSMHMLGMERIGVDEVHRLPWESLAPRLKKWIKAMKASVRVLFASERFLCNEIFCGDCNCSDACFGLVCNEPALQLLRVFAEVAVGPESPDRLFPLLDVYEALKLLMPELESAFQGDPCAEVPAEARKVLNLLKDAVRGTFVVLRNAIESNASRTASPGGALHPLIRFVMNTLGLLSEYLEPLKEIFRDDEDAAAAAAPSTGASNNAAAAAAAANGESVVNNNNSSRSSSSGSSSDGEASALEREVMRVLQALLANLEEHSRLYRERALACVFLMNNTHYIVQKVKALELHSVIRDEWVRSNSSRVRFHAMNYQRESWGRIFSFLRDEGIRSGYSNVSREVLKDRFKSFNAAFEEVHRAQASWVVPDAGLRDELRVLIADKLLPAYRSFLGRYRVHLEGVRHFERYLKYSVEDLEDLLNDLFEGAPVSVSRRRSISGAS